MIGKKAGEHGAHAVECDRHTCFRSRSTNSLFEISRNLLERFVHAGLGKEPKRLDAGGHRKGISRQGACLIDGSDGSDFLHDLTSAAESPYRQTAANHFAEACKVWFDLVALLSASVRYAEAGHHLVEDEDDAVLIADPPEAFEKSRFGRHAAHVPCHRLDNNACDLLTFTGCDILERVEIVVRNRDGELRQICRDARTVRQSERRNAASGFHEQAVAMTALMKLRGSSRRPEESIEDLLPRFDADSYWATEVHGWGATSDALLERRETRMLVRRCIDRLPETYRTVLVLRDIEDLDTEEVAEQLGITSNATKIRLHRARQALRTLLDRELRTDAIGGRPERPLPRWS